MALLEVILDAATLFPPSLRDITLRLAEIGLYTPHWTDEILEEMRRNLVAKGKMTEQQTEKLLVAMEGAFPEANLPKARYEHIIGQMRNDPGDRHVLAAAIACKARIIVTPNLRHFLKAILDPLGIEAQSPDTFLMTLFTSNPPLVTNTIDQQARELKKSVKTIAGILTVLEKHAPNTVKEVRLYLQSNP